MDGKAMTQGTPWKVILRFALPLMGANVLQQLYNTIDTLVVGNFDSQAALSAVGSCAYLVNFYLAIALGFSLGAGVLAAQAFGGGKEEELKRRAGTGILLLCAMGIGMTGISLLTNSLWLRHVIRVPEMIYRQAFQYITIYCVGLLFQFGYNIAAALLRSIGDSRSSLYFLAVTSALNVLLDLLFVCVFRWGAAGVALATTLAQAVSMAVSFLYLFRKYPRFRPSKETWRWDGTLARRILKLGAPMVIQQVVVSCGFMLLQSIVNSFGETMTASYTVACRLECFMLVPLSSLGSAMSTYAGQNLGARQPGRIREGARQTVLLCLLIALSVGAAVYLLAEPLISLFGLTEGSAGFCVSHVRLVCFDLLIYGSYQPLSGLFQGVGKGKISMAMSIAELTGRVVLAGALSRALGEAAVWWNEPASFLLAGIIAYGYSLTGKWKEK